MCSCAESRTVPVFCVTVRAPSHRRGDVVHEQGELNEESPAVLAVDPEVRVSGVQTAPSWICPFHPPAATLMGATVMLRGTAVLRVL